MRISDWSSDVCSSDLEKGIKVIKSDHKRDKSLLIVELMLRVANQFSNPVAAKDWLGEIYKIKSRYMRDQLQIIQQVLAEPEAANVAHEAMTFCHQNRIHSAVDFKAIIEQHLKDSKPKERSEEHTSALQSLMRNSYA